MAPAYVVLGAFQMSCPETSFLTGTCLGVNEKEGVGTRLEPLSVCERQMKEFPHCLLSLSPYNSCLVSVTVEGVEISQSSYEKATKRLMFSTGSLQRKLSDLFRPGRKEEKLGSRDFPL